MGFDAQARNVSWEMFTRRHRDAAMIAITGLALVGLAGLFRRRGGDNSATKSELGQASPAGGIVGPGQTVEK